MTIEEMRQKLAGDFQEATDDDLRTMQSKEYAESIRPGHQWVAILEVGLFLLFLFLVSLNSHLADNNEIGTWSL